MGRGALVIDESIIEDELASINKYDVRIRDTYSVFHQIARVTREPGALIHDDRLDALEGGVRHFAEALAVDQKKAVEASQAAAWKEMQNNLRGRFTRTDPPARRAGFMTRVRKL